MGITPRFPTHSDGGKQSLGHVGHDDADEEDDGLQPGVAQDDGEDEEGDAQEDGHAGDDVDEVLDLSGDGRLAHLKARGQGSDTAHHGLVAGADDNTAGSSCTNTEARSEMMPSCINPFKHRI